ncbi:CaiB/BaiF CoA transferase family protein [Pseudonocardia yuanmonensis]
MQDITDDPGRPDGATWPSAVGPLQGVRVIDLTTVVMGPYATAVLGDLGADVVKVEPLDGDMTRGIGARRHAGMTAMTLNLQRNKRSIALNLREPDGLAALRRLVEDADVIVTNLRPRSRERLGITYEALSECNPRLVMCTAQAYSSRTELADSPAYDDIVQAASGAALLTDRVYGQPSYAPYVIADKVVALHIAVAALAAVLRARTTGRGQSVDVPMVDAMIAFNLVEHLGGHTFDPPEGDFGWSRILVAERRPHRTADGWICIMPYSDQNWRDFFALAGQPELADDPRFREVNVRHRNMNELLATVGQMARHRTTDEWLELCAKHEIPASELLDLAAVGEDDYVRERNLLRSVEHPSEGRYFVTPTPMDFSETPVGLTRHAPRLGENSAEILAQAGYSPGEVADLFARNVVAGDHPAPVNEECA